MEKAKDKWETKSLHEKYNAEYWLHSHMTH